MKSFNNGTYGGYPSQTYELRRPATGFNHARVETQLLPNEIRVSSNGNFNGYVKQILYTMEQGYANCKIVGRGMAAQITWDLLQTIMKKAPHYHYDKHQTTALNKRGIVVDELHVMVSNDGDSDKPMGKGNNYRNP